MSVETLTKPSARKAKDPEAYCHITMNGRKALCGYIRPRNRPRHAIHSLILSGMCVVCERPRCPACIQQW